MIYYKILAGFEIINVKRLSLTVGLFKVVHDYGSLEIYKNPVTEKWSILSHSNPLEKHSAWLMGQSIDALYEDHSATSN